MRRLAALLLLATPALPAAAAEPVLERVLLSTSGVGWLGLRAEAGTIRFEVPFRQVDDVLKSLTLLDGGGTVRSILLPGPTPLDDPFRDTPFGPGDLADLPRLLERLKGAEVEVAAAMVGPAPLRGRVLAVVPEETRDGEGARTLRHRLSLLTDGGIRSLLLEDLASLRPTDPALLAALRLALGRLADGRLQPARELVVELDGAAPGSPVRLGYLAEMPVWKATYRLVAGGSDGLLQGWAVLDNRSGRDWRDVDVTLVAGSPTALRQALYRSHYVPRPEAPVLPEAPPAALAPEAEAPLALRDVPRGLAAMAAAPELDRAVAEELIAQTLYRLAQPVTLAQGETAMVPLVDRAVPVARLARFRLDRAGDGHPEAALRLRNAAAVSLPGGLSALFERAPETGGLTFLGDAAVPPLAPDEEIVLAYGRDGNIDVHARLEEGRRLERAKVVDGVLELARVERVSTVYEVTSRFAGPPRELLLEQTLPPGWRVAAPADARVEGGQARVSAVLEAGSARTLTVVTERPEIERVALVDVDPEQFLLDVTGDAPPELRAAVDRLRLLEAAAADAGRALAAASERRTALVAEQERLRANLEAVPGESELARRYLDRLGASEEAIAALDRDLESLRAREAAAGEARREFLRTLRL